jgi:L-lysine exporter family protein LysE/ArgO
MLTLTITKNIFTEGVLSGLAYVVPIGPQNIFLISAALLLPLHKSLFISLLVLIADTSLAIICFFGLGGFLVQSFALRIALSLIGALVIFFIGYRLIFINNKHEINDEALANKDFLFYAKGAFIVTFANPQAIIDGALIYGALRSTYDQSSLTSFFLGSVLSATIWFLGLAILTNILREKILKIGLKWIEKTCGIILVLIGIKIIWNLFRNVYGI